VNIQRAAEQRSELRPGRGFASLGLWFVRFGSREAATEFITGSDLPVIPVAPPGLDHLRGVDPRLAKPHLGLNSDRCYAARCSLIESFGIQPTQSMAFQKSLARLWCCLERFPGI